VNPLKRQFIGAGLVYGDNHKYIHVDTIPKVTALSTCVCDRDQSINLVASHYSDKGHRDSMTPDSSG